MIYEPIPPKRCTKCKQWFPMTRKYFRSDRSKRDGYHPHCKNCKGKADSQYADTHREEVRENLRTWRRNNPERNKEIERRSRLNNAVANLESQRKCRAKHPEKYRARVQRCRKAKPALYQGFKHVRRAREKNVPATFSPTDWQRALDYFGGCCAVCGRKPEGRYKLAQDHWIPVARNGAYTPENILPLCQGKRGCNNVKNDQMPEEWLIAELGEEQAQAILAKIAAYFQAISTL